MIKRVEFRTSEKKIENHFWRRETKRKNRSRQITVISRRQTNLQQKILEEIDIKKKKENMKKNNI